MKKLLIAAALLMPVAAMAQQTAPSQVNGGIFFSAPQTLSDKQSGVFQLDNTGRLKTTSSSVISGTATITGTSLSMGAYNSGGVSPTNGQQIAQQVDQYGRQLVNAGSAITVADQPTVQNAVYAAGACLGGWRQITIATSNGQTGFLTGLRVASVGGSTPTIYAYASDTSPTSFCADKVAFSLAAGDIAHLIFNPAGNSITLAAPANDGTSTAFGSTDFTPPRPFMAGGSTGSGLKTIWLGLVTSTVVTPASTSDIRTHIGAALN